MQDWVRMNGNANTRRTYESGLRGFLRYLDDNGIQLAATRACDIAHYLRLRFENDGVAAATLAGDRSAIGDGLKGTPGHGLHLSPLVTDTLRLAMQKAAQSKPKQHVSAELMRALVKQHDSDPSVDWIAHRNVAMLLAMMAGMLRESEAVALRMEDVRVQYVEQAAAAAGGEVAESVSLTIRQSKTDQAAKGAVVMLATNPSEPSMCPVRRLQQYISARAQAHISTEYLFPKSDGGEMSRSTPCGIVQKMVAEHPDWGKHKTLVLAHHDWHPGVIGIVASRVSEEFGN